MISYLRANCRFKGFTEKSDNELAESWNFPDMDKHTSLLMCLRTQNSRAKTWKHLASIIKNISNKKTVLSPTSYRHKWLCMTVFGHLGIPFFIVLTVRLLFQLLFCLLMVFGFQLGCIHRSIHLSFSHMFILRLMLTFVNNPIQMWDTV